jgi:hypothetical protein
VEFLRAGGWFPEKAGATGAPRGRPVTGITNPDSIELALRQVCEAILQAGEGLAPLSPVGDRDPVGRYVLIACFLGVSVNTESLARFLGRDASTVRRNRRKGEQWIRDSVRLFETEFEPKWAEIGLPAKSPKGGGTEQMNATATTAIIERLDRIELLESMRAETMDRIRITVDELAAHFLDDERIEVAVEDLFSKN